MGLIQECLGNLIYLREHMRPTFVTAWEFAEWSERDPDAVDHYDAERIARFVRRVALDAEIPSLVQAADDVLAKASEISRRSYGTEQTNMFESWQRRLGARARRETEIRDRPERWASRGLVTTRDIGGMLWPKEERGHGVTYLFQILKALGYLDGSDGAWTLTERGIQVGELRGKRSIYWKKEVLDVLRAELRRRHPGYSFGATESAAG